MFQKIIAAPIKLFWTIDIIEQIINKSEYSLTAYDCSAGAAVDIFLDLFFLSRSFLLLYNKHMWKQLITIEHVLNIRNGIFESHGMIHDTPDVNHTSRVLYYIYYGT